METRYNHGPFPEHYNRIYTIDTRQFRSQPYTAPCPFKQQKMRGQKVQPVMIRLVHAARSIPAVDVFINGKKVLEKISYRLYTPYFPMPPGEHLIEIYIAGSSVLLSTSRHHLSAGKLYTGALSGTHENFKVKTFRDDPNVPKNEAKFRFIHLASSNSAINIAVKNRDTIFKNISYRKSTAYLGLTPMTIDLEVRGNETREIQPLPPFRAAPDTAYTIILLGSIEEGKKTESILLVDTLQQGYKTI